MSRSNNLPFKLLLTATALALLAMASGCQQQLADATVVGQASKTVMINNAEIYNTGNIQLVDAVISPRYLGHFSSLKEPVIGRKGFTDWVQLNRTVFSDFRVDINEIIAENNMVCLKWTVTGTHTGELENLEPSGKWIRVEGLTLAKIEEGKIVEEWVTWDVLDFYRQLGVAGIPEMMQR